MRNNFMRTMVSKKDSILMRPIYEAEDLETETAEIPTDE